MFIGAAAAAGPRGVSIVVTGTQPLRVMSKVAPRAIIAGAAAVEAWFLGGPVDGRLMPVKTTGEGTPPEVVRMAQDGLYAGAAVPPTEHVYVLAERVDDIQVYRHRATLGV
ncbi:hypothetical protein U2F26_30915 [Micromonospora sp. 4G57]|uniref:Uncharacterized protein n=1 Tax=Micromonospora sicca TaxID=2202420 RepID=A0ABU5JKA7_9ACTN|nr:MULTISPECIES: hypothetical protein [unclassified Micromonospora]MDZ5447080.1 hypothetical protein [Micromonospora sp. 4G57]MDZ5493043.1 hypothetical protein [Micromonospora sp. 4G53]